MEDLLLKIYQSVVCNEEASIRMAEKYDKQIDEILGDYKDDVTNVDEEQLRALLYDVAYITEEGGFILGARFMARFIYELLKMESE